jgi:DNA-3-methyladenine glycosylase
VGRRLTAASPASGGPEPASGPLPRAFFDRPALEVAPDLLGCVLRHETGEGPAAVLITEVEAYLGATDPASHSFRGQTARNAVMFGGPGHAYVYFTYGMHYCVNLTCQPPGTAEAVLLRAGRVTEGAALAAARRSAGRASSRPLAERDLARGPARLCQALGIDRALDGADACDQASPLQIQGRAAMVAPDAISRGPRIGISQAVEEPWRYWITGDPTVSPFRAHVPRRRV